MKRATCVGHSTLPRAQTRWLGAPFEVPWHANQAAANVTCFRPSSGVQIPPKIRGVVVQICSCHARAIFGLLRLKKISQARACDTSDTLARRVRSEAKTIFGRQNGKAFEMLPWQLHHDAPRRHQICPYPYTCTAHMLANCMLH